MTVNWMALLVWSIGVFLFGSAGFLLYTLRPRWYFDTVDRMQAQAGLPALPGMGASADRISRRMRIILGIVAIAAVILFAVSLIGVLRAGG